MKSIEANVYPIENLKELSCKYRVYRILGLSPESEDYDKNVQFLATKLSNITDSPCITFKEKNETFVAQPEGYKEPPSSLDLVRVPVKIEKLPELRELRFDSLNSLTVRLAKRFLEGSLQRQFYNNFSLWQPRIGYPFYSKHPDREARHLSKSVDMYRGFTFRVMQLPRGQLGICADVTNKYVSRFPLPTKIERNDFQKYRGSKCVYEYSNRWYEIRIGDLNTLNADKLKLPNGRTLFEEVHYAAGSRKSPNLLALPRDSSVIIYYNTWRQQRNAPSGLCRLTLGTNHPHVRRFHDKSIKHPEIRRSEINFIINRHFKNLEFGSTKIKLSNKPYTAKEKKFIPPDLKFGNNKILSVRNSPKTINVSLEEFRRKKRDLVYSEGAGLYIKKRFYRQYFIVPKSVYESFGGQFVEDVKNGVNELFHSDDGILYSPIIIPYDDSVQKSVYIMGKKIIDAFEENKVGEGFGIIMIPKIKSTYIKNEDELGNLLMREFRDREIYVSIIHTNIPSESYENLGNGQWSLSTDRNQLRRYRGYLKNVVLNKILILNSYWPFVLDTPLNADFIIGIDIKNDVAGFTIIHKDGAKIKFDLSESRDKEKLSESHMCQKIMEIITNEQKYLPRNIRNIVIHRQGRLFTSEKRGISSALEKLAQSDVIPKDYKPTFVEIKSTSKAPFRLFKIEIPPGTQKEVVNNPTIGTYRLVSEEEAFICTTGPPYWRRGTSNPLHVMKISGELSLEKILEDIFYLSNLTWTRIDDCSRHPISIKMTDIRLKEFAGDYDRDKLRFLEEEE